MPITLVKMSGNAVPTGHTVPHEQVATKYCPSERSVERPEEKKLSPTVKEELKRLTTCQICESAGHKQKAASLRQKLQRVLVYLTC